MTEENLGRGDLRMLSQLARQPGWFQELPDGLRRSIMTRLLNVLQKQDLRTRELVSVAKVIANLEKNDLERGKMLARVIEQDEGEE